MFGSPRSGSTWLLNMLGTRTGITTIDEPGIGSHLGLFSPDVFVAPARTFPPDKLRVNDGRASNANYFFADQFADVWRPGLRELMLDRFAAHIDREQPRPSRCFIKEPNGSQAADLVMSLLPASRLLALVRDGRDVVDSQLDAYGENTWLGKWVGGRTLSADERLAQAFAALGVSAGDSVALMCRNHRGFVEASIAAAKLGADILYLNTAFAGPQLVEVLEREQPALVVHDEEFTGLLAKAEAGTSVLAWTDSDTARVPTVSTRQVPRSGWRKTRRAGASPRAR